MTNEVKLAGTVQEFRVDGKTPSARYFPAEGNRSGMISFTMVLDSGQSRSYIQCVAYGVVAKLINDRVGREAEIEGYIQNKKGSDGKWRTQVVAAEVVGSPTDTLAPESIMSEVTKARASKPIKTGYIDSKKK